MLLFNATGTCHDERGVPLHQTLNYVKLDGSHNSFVSMKIFPKYHYIMYGTETMYQCGKAKLGANITMITEELNPSGVKPEYS